MKKKKTFIITSIIMIVMLCIAFTVKTFQREKIMIVNGFNPKQLTGGKQL